MLTALFVAPGGAAVMQVGSLGALGANDALLWSAPGGTVSGTQFSLTSMNGVGVTGQQPSGGYAIIQQAPMGSWNGDFPANAFIVDNNWGGPSTFTFSTPIQGFGVSLDNAWSTLNSTDTIQVFNGANLLNTFTVNGTGLLFLGVLDDTAEITSVVVTSNNANGNGYFAFSDLSLVDPVRTPAGVPEPATVGLMVAGIGAMLLGRRKLVG
jgi:hypothetical protein